MTGQVGIKGLLVAFLLTLGACSESKSSDEAGSPFGSALSDKEAMQLASASLKRESFNLPIGSFSIRNGFDPDQNDLHAKRLYGRITHQMLLAAQNTGFMTLNVQRPTLFGGLNLAATSALVDPLPDYVETSEIPESISVGIGERACRESVSLSEVKGAEVNNHPVFTYECRFTFITNPYGTNFENAVREAGFKLESQLWMKEGKGKFLLEWDNFSKSYKVSLSEVISPDESNWPGEIDKRISTLRAPS